MDQISLKTFQDLTFPIVREGKVFRSPDKTFGSWKDENHPKLTTQEELDEHINKLRDSYTERLERLWGVHSFS